MKMTLSAPIWCLFVEDLYLVQVMLPHSKGAAGAHLRRLPSNPREIQIIIGNNISNVRNHFLEKLGGVEP